MAPFWSPPTAQATRPRPRLLAENGRTGLESGPQPHIIASPPGTGAPIDRINYTPETGEVHPPGVLAPTDKLNYSLVPHDDLNYAGQLGQNSGQTAAPPAQAQGGGAAGGGMASALQPGQGQALPSNVWKNTGQPGAGAESIVNSPGTPAGTDGLTGRYGENATLRSNAFSPGQPPLSPTPYGTGPGPRAQASGPTQRPMDQRASMTGNLANWGQSMGTGADDDTNDEADPLDAIYGGDGGGTGQPAVAPTDQGTPGVATPPTTEAQPAQASQGYHFEYRPPQARGADGKLQMQELWSVPDDPAKGPPIPLGYLDAQTKAGTTERPYHKFTEKEQRTKSPDFAKQLDDAQTGKSTTNKITVIQGADGQQHKVMVDNQGHVISDLGLAGQAPKAAPTGQGDEKIVGPDSLHPTVLVKQPDGSYVEDTARSAQLAAENKDKLDTKASQDELDRQTRLDASQSKPFTVYNDQSGQSWLVNTQTGEKEKMGSVDPKAGIFESNGRLIKIGDDGKPVDLYKPPPGFDLHYDSFGRAVAINKEDPSQPPITAYQPEDYDEQRATAKQKALLDIEKTKSDLATSKITQVDSRAKMMDALQKMEHPEARFMGTSDIYLPSGSAADVQRYNPETKTSTYEHVSGGDLSPEQKANAARMHSMLDELDKAMAGGDTSKANALATQVQQSQGAQPAQPATPQEEQPGVIPTVSHGGQDIRPGYPGYDPEHLGGAAQPPTQRTTAAGDIAHYDEHGALTGIDYRNTAPPGYEELGSTLSEGLDQGAPDQGTPEQGAPGEEQPVDESAPQQEDYWAKRRQRYMGTGTDIPQGGQGNPKPAGRPGYDTTPTPTPVPPPSPPPGGLPPGAPPEGGPPPMGGAPPNAAGGGNPADLAAQPGYNPLHPPDLAALGPPGGGGGTAPGIMPGAMPDGAPGGMPGGAGQDEQGGLPNLQDPLFQFALQRRQAGGQGMGGGQDEPAQPNASSYAGWTPPVPQGDVAGIGHRFGQQMNVGEPQHSGVDLQAVEGTPTISPVDGTVQRVEYNPQGLGITVVLQGKDGTTHKLGHLKKTDAYPGLVVSQGQDLQSQVGSTGNTTGSHLHWAVKTPDGQPTDPTASLGGMASMPPVPGTQMMGPPGGSSAPGVSQRGPMMSGASGPGPLAVPATQGAPPTPAAQPAPPGGPQPPMMGQGAGADLGSPDLPESPDTDPLSPFGMNRKNPFGFNDRNLMLLWNQQHKRWVDAQMKQQGSFRTGSTSGGAQEKPQVDEEGKPVQEWWQEREDQPRAYDPNAGPRTMPRSNIDPVTGKPMSRSGMAKRPDDVEPQLPTTKPDVSPYREGNTNPYPPSSDAGKSWQRQNDWFRRKQQPQVMVNEQIDKLAQQGWPPEAIDEMKALGRRPTKAEIEAIRAKYKEPGVPETPAAPEQGSDTQARQARAEKFGQAHEANQQAWAPRGVANPEPAPEKTGAPLESLAPEPQGPTEKQWKDYTPEDIARMDPTERAEYEDWLHNEKSGYNDAVKRGDTGGALGQGNKMVTPPVDTGGGHKPPVGPSIEDLMKPNIFMPPTLGPGGHVPGPPITLPGGHVPGPEIKLPNVTDKGANWTPKWPDVSLPGWLPGQGGPDVTDQGPPGEGTPESYSDMLERLRQMGQGAGADDGDDAQIAAVLGISPEQITDEIRSWWQTRPQPGASPQSGDAGMGAGLQLGPVHLSTTMRQPTRMPSSRMETSRRAGWTPRAGGMKRRSSAGTSAMLSI